MMRLPIDIDWIDQLFGALSAIDQSPPEVTTSSQGMSAVMESWQGTAAQSFARNSNEVFESCTALESVIHRFVADIGAFRAAMRQCQAEVNSANYAAEECHMDLDTDGNLPGSEWGSAELQWTFGDRRRVEGAVNIAVNSIRDAIALFNSSLQGLSRIDFDVTSGPVSFGEEVILSSVTQSEGGWFKAHVDEIVALSRSMGAAEQAELGRFQSTRLGLGGTSGLSGSSERFPEARSTVHLLETCCNLVRGELQRIAASFGSLQNLLLKAADQYGDAELMAEGVLTTTGAGGLTIAMAPADYTGTGVDPPEGYISWCKANKYYQDGEYEQCVAWAQYQRQELGLPWHHGNGAQMCAVGDGVVPCGPDGVSEGSLISFADPPPYGHVMVVESVRAGPPLVFTCSELNVRGDAANNYDGYGKSGDFLTNTTITAIPTGQDSYRYVQTRQGYGSTQVSGLSFCTGVDGG